MTESLARHALVTPTPAAWAAFLETRPDLATEPLIAGWVAAGYPLIVRRSIGEEPDGLVPLGLPLPPAQGKRRIAVTLDRADILLVTPPPLLAAATVVASANWQSCIAQLIELDPMTRCFGSLAWQYLTGLAYLTENSDLDLLWQMLPGVSISSDHIDLLLTRIATIADTAPMRIDGEILGVAGGVNWRELYAKDGGEILLKGPQQVRMMPRQAFLTGAMP